MNADEQMVVDFATRMEMAVVNTYFKKREEYRVTYIRAVEGVRKWTISFVGGHT